LLADYAELGPLDAQYYDREREQIASALDEVQALERLHAFGLEAIDRTTFFFMERSGLKITNLLPLSLEYVSDMMRPLFEKIDAVHYTQMARTLKVAEEYATRLLRAEYPDKKAEHMARHLVEKYPTHDFVIDRDEAASFGLKTESPTPEVAEILDTIQPYLGRVTAFGLVQEVAQ
jgi:hypothetical protein